METLEPQDPLLTGPPVEPSVSPTVTTQGARPIGDFGAVSNAHVRARRHRVEAHAS